jgi:hypothetical protein
VAWAILALGVGALAAGALASGRIADVVRARPRAVVLGLAALAALLSWGYVVHYLRGGPRIVDATSYFLEARALAAGLPSFPVPDPSGSFRGRFLLTPPEGATLAVLFPPGYPALLALGFLLGAPLAVGPLLAAALTITTYALALELFGKREVALLAATLSVLCAALRYHTADTMSHGWAAVLFASTLFFSLRGGRATLAAGLCLGWLVATRPVTGLVALAFAVFACSRRRRAELLLLALGLLPGLALLALHQHAATGSVFGSTQLRYYALADGPPGCFRYGFGSGIGCQFEHGDFVREHLSGGYRLRAALGTTGRRLWMHMGDLANAWPLFGFLLVSLFLGRRERAVRMAAFPAVALVVAYAPFYFDGNYPGGGARLLAEALPLEHAILAWGLTRLRLARFAPGVLCLAFAVRASQDHTALRDREGGRPMFEPAVLARAGVSKGLLFVSTDHGFNLAHVPGARDPTRELVVARFRDDAHDFWLWDALGRPPAHRYVFDSTGARAPRVDAFAPNESDTLDAGAEWPPLAVRGGFAHPDYVGAACARGRYGLRLHGATVVVAAMARAEGPHRIITRWVALDDGPAAVRLEAGGVSWSATWPGKSGECFEAASPPIDVGKGPFRLELSALGDELTVRPVSAPRARGKGVDN